jgi:hypothetical protein
MGSLDLLVSVLSCNSRGRCGLACLYAAVQSARDATNVVFIGIPVQSASVGAMVLECQWAALQPVLWIWIIGALPCTQYPPGAVGLAFIARLCDQLYCAELLWARPGRDLRRGRALRCEVSEMKCRRVLVPDLGYVCIWCIAYQGLTGVSFK